MHGSESLCLNPRFSARIPLYLSKKHSAASTLPYMLFSSWIAYSFCSSSVRNPSANISSGIFMYILVLGLALTNAASAPYTSKTHFCSSSVWGKRLSVVHSRYHHEPLGHDTGLVSASPILLVFHFEYSLVGTGLWPLLCTCDIGTFFHASQCRKFMILSEWQPSKSQHPAFQGFPQRLWFTQVWVELCGETLELQSLIKG